MPSGELRLVITNVHAMRQRWSEGPQKPLEGMLNKFMIGLVRAALRVKVQRAEAERLERERQEEERQVQEEARRLAEVELRWREEEARVERLVRLQAMWRRNRGLREIVLALKAAVGDIDAESGLGKWLAWVEKYAELSDPLNRFRNRRLEPLTVYYYGWNSERVAQEGFEEPELTGYSKEREKPGIEVTERPPRRSAYERALKLEIPEDVLLAYEWPQESDDYWRVFRVPAAVLNRALRHSSSGDEAIVPPEQG